MRLLSVFAHGHCDWLRGGITPEATAARGARHAIAKQGMHNFCPAPTPPPGIPKPRCERSPRLLVGCGS